VRSVVPIRLSDAERGQIQAAAARRKMTLSGFIRQAALASSAIVEGKAWVRVPESEPEREGLLIVDTEPAGHYVDGELIRRQSCNCPEAQLNVPRQDRSLSHGLVDLE
jgi:hypothetical protein